MKLLPGVCKPYCNKYNNLKTVLGVKVIQNSTKLNHKNIRILVLHLLQLARGTFRCMGR